MEDAAALLGGASSHRHSSAFDLSEVDFEYVEKLGKKDVRKLNGIILALEQEGAYPDLLRTCRQKLAEIDPNRSVRNAEAIVRIRMGTGRRACHTKNAY